MSGDEILIPDFSLIEAGASVHRLVVAIDGRQRQGRTHFSLTAPDPIVLMDFDMGTEGMVEKFLMPMPEGASPVEKFEMGGKTILRSKPFIVKPPEVTDEMGGEDLAKAEWERFRNAYVHVLNEPVMRRHGKPVYARTLVVDTSTELYELLRLYWFGKLVQIPTFKYRETNSVMRDLVRHGLESGVNVIFIHKMKAEWKKTGGTDEKQSKTGAYERAGFEEMAHLVQANLFAYRAPMPDGLPQTWKYKPGMGEAFEWVAEPRAAQDDLGFRVRILDSRHNPNLEGLELSNEMATFPMIAQAMMPDSTLEDWQ